MHEEENTGKAFEYHIIHAGQQYLIMLGVGFVVKDSPLVRVDMRVTSHHPRYKQKSQPYFEPRHSRFNPERTEWLLNVACTVLFVKLHLQTMLLSRRLDYS